MRFRLWTAIGVIVASGCGQNAPHATQDEHPVANQATGNELAPAPQQSTSPPAPVAAAPPAPLPAEAPDETSREPATVEQATAVLDLSKFPLVPGAQEPGARQIASLGYAAASELKSAFEFQRKALLERGFQELGDPQIHDQSASGSYGKDGFYVSVSVYPAGEAGQVGIRLQNHGNLNLARLPVPPGAKLSYSFPAVTSFSTDAPLQETTVAVRQLLLEQGWQPYGTAGDSLYFKKNAVQLSARVLSPPAQPGKTAIDFSAQLLSADLPAPPDAERVQYADSNKRLDVEAIGTPDDVVAFYKQSLAPAGWQATTENRITDRNTSFLIFRNSTKDLLTLNMRDLGDRKTRLDLKHQSAAEVEEEERRLKVAIEEKKRKEEAEKNRPVPTIAIALPADASSVDVQPQEIEFQVPTGKSHEALRSILAQLQADGWQAEPLAGDKMAGLQSLKKNDLEISIQHVDPGFIPAQITISARAKLQLKGTGVN